MDPSHAAAIFAALSQETRVRLLHRLVPAGPTGMSAGEIGAALSVAASTLSFHLTALEHAGLIERTRRGRQLIYTARGTGLHALLGSAAALCFAADRHAEAQAVRLLAADDGPPRMVPNFSVLFVCRQNSARSILAEAILRQVGDGQFRAHSAGPRPAAGPLPQVIDLLRTMGHDVAPLRSKSWKEFARPSSAPMDFVITLCDMPEHLERPDFGAGAVAGLWLLPDPAKFAGSPAERGALLRELYGGIRRRLEAFCRIPFATLNRIAAQARLDAIADPILAR